MRDRLRSQNFARPIFAAMQWPVACRLGRDSIHSHSPAPDPNNLREEIGERRDFRIFSAKEYAFAGRRVRVWVAEANCKGAPRWSCVHQRRQGWPPQELFLQQRASSDEMNFFRLRLLSWPREFRRRALARA